MADKNQAINLLENGLLSSLNSAATSQEPMNREAFLKDLMTLTQYLKSSVGSHESTNQIESTAVQQPTPPAPPAIHTTLQYPPSSYNAGFQSSSPPPAVSPSQGEDALQIFTLLTAFKLASSRRIPIPTLPLRIEQALSQLRTRFQAKISVDPMLATRRYPMAFSFSGSSTDRAIVVNHKLIPAPIRQAIEALDADLFKFFDRLDETSAVTQSALETPAAQVPTVSPEPPKLHSAQAHSLPIPSFASSELKQRPNPQQYQQQQQQRASKQQHKQPPQISAPRPVFAAPQITAAIPSITTSQFTDLVPFATDSAAPQQVPAIQPVQLVIPAPAGAPIAALPIANPLADESFLDKLAQRVVALIGGSASDAREAASKLLKSSTTSEKSASDRTRQRSRSRSRSPRTRSPPRVSRSQSTSHRSRSARSRSRDRSRSRERARSRTRSRSRSPRRDRTTSSRASSPRAKTSSHSARSSDSRPQTRSSDRDRDRDRSEKRSPTRVSSTSDPSRPRSSAASTSSSPPSRDSAKASGTKDGRRTSSDSQDSRSRHGASTDSKSRTSSSTAPKGSVTKTSTSHQTSGSTRSSATATASASRSSTSHSSPRREGGRSASTSSSREKSGQQHDRGSSRSGTSSSGDRSRELRDAKTTSSRSKSPAPVSTTATPSQPSSAPRDSQQKQSEQTPKTPSTSPPHTSARQAPPAPNSALLMTEDALYEVITVSDGGDSPEPIERPKPADAPTTQHAGGETGERRMDIETGCSSDQFLDISVDLNVFDDSMLVEGEFQQEEKPSSPVSASPTLPADAGMETDGGISTSTVVVQQDRQPAVSLSRHDDDSAMAPVERVIQLQLVADDAHDRIWTLLYCHEEPVPEEPNKPAPPPKEVKEPTTESRSNKRRLEERPPQERKISPPRVASKSGGDRRTSSATTANKTVATRDSRSRSSSVSTAADSRSLPPTSSVRRSDTRQRTSPENQSSRGHRSQQDSSSRQTPTPAPRRLSPEPKRPRRPPPPPRKDTGRSTANFSAPNLTPVSSTISPRQFSAPVTYQMPLSPPPLPPQRPLSDRAKVPQPLVLPPQPTVRRDFYSPSSTIPAPPSWGRSVPSPPHSPMSIYDSFRDSGFATSTSYNAYPLSPAPAEPVHPSRTYIYPTSPTRDQGVYVPSPMLSLPPPSQDYDHHDGQYPNSRNQWIPNPVYAARNDPLLPPLPSAHDRRIPPPPGWR